MNRRTLFRSLGLTAIVAGVAALPKMPTRPEDVVPEGGPAFTKEPSEPLTEGVHPVIGAIDRTGPYPMVWDGKNWTTQFPMFYGGPLPSDPTWQVPSIWTSSGANHLTFTSASTLTITGAANSTTGVLQVVG